MQHVEFELEREDMIAFADHHVSHDPIIANRTRTMRMVWAILCVVLAFIRSNRRPEFAVGMIVFGLAIFIFYPSVVRGLYRRQYRRSIQNLDPANFGRVELTLDNHQIRSKSAAGEIATKVSLLNHLEETPDYYFIYLSPIQAIIIPKQRILSGDMDALASELGQTIPMKSF